ncbi:hypothetical protein BDR03DRAFT_939663 [Suillus americanus]|nr:hypothetical protein BDR03DRAFT_939663 [Suillus americanus]
MLPMTKSDNGHIGACSTSLYLYLPYGCVSYSMSFFTPFYITPSTPTYSPIHMTRARSSLWHGATMCKPQPPTGINSPTRISLLIQITSYIWHELERQY